MTKLINDQVGPQAVRKYIPKTLNPKLKEEVDEILGGDAGPPPAPDPPALAPKANTAKKGPAAKTPAPPPAASNPKPTSARAPSARAHSRIPPPASGDAVASATGDDPKPYLAELANREKQFGKDHPRVAETCSNLAILYNQQGQAKKALPLYERALAIYEKAHGPEHPDVAHTLTDLAVLHLEQVSGLFVPPCVHCIDCPIFLPCRVRRRWDGPCWNEPWISRRGRWVLITLMC